MVVNRSLKFHPHLLQPFELCQLDQNYDYCTDNDVLGPIYPSHELINSNEILDNPVVAAGTRNLYFLASHDQFDVDSLYEYHELKESLEYGYMFGLFSLKYSDWGEIKSILR